MHQRSMRDCHDFERLRFERYVLAVFVHRYVPAAAIFSLTNIVLG